MQMEEVEKYTHNHYLKNKSYQLMFTSLLPILRYEDRNSMAYSIEARLPFLDYRLVSFVFSQPVTQFIHKGWSKWLLRQAMANILPEEVRWRSDKMGFVTPQNLWLKNELATLVREILNDPRFLNRPYWYGQKILKAYEDWVIGKDNLIQNYLWPILSTELWLRLFIDQRPTPPN